MTKQIFSRAKYACYMTSLSSAVTGNLPPLLFVSLRRIYGLSYTLLGLLVLINFGTQLLFDLVFSFCSHKFNLQKAVRLTPVVMSAGLLCFAFLPLLFPKFVYGSLVIGTVVFSAGGGLSEVLTSPTIAAIPSDNPERSMSRLHSCYAFGVVLTVLVSAFYIRLFGDEKWYLLTLLLTGLPLMSALLFAKAPMPELKTAEKTSDAAGSLKNPALLLCVLCIFLGGASECTMSQWCSTFAEKALGISKIYGDLFGVALFGAMLGLGRTLYAKFGKNILRFLTIGSAGAAVCYLTAVFCPLPIVGLLACALTGFFVSMLWPGSLIVVSDRVPDCGVSVYALMAAGGDLGASAVPQALGIIADMMIIAGRSEEFGMKAGLLFASLFPICEIVVCLVLIRSKKKKAA